jgi:hypothetical protein
VSIPRQRAAHDRCKLGTGARRFLTANTPTLIDEFLPAYDVAERHQVEVRARIERVYDAVRSLDLGSSGVVRMLFWLRDLPALFLPSSCALRAGAQPDVSGSRSTRRWTAGSSSSAKDPTKN